MEECKTVVNLSKVKMEMGNIQMASCIQFNFTLQTMVKSGLNLLTRLTYVYWGLLSKLGSLLHGTLLFLMVKHCFFFFYFDEGILVMTLLAVLGKVAWKHAIVNEFLLVLNTIRISLLIFFLFRAFLMQLVPIF